MSRVRIERVMQHSGERIHDVKLPPWPESPEGVLCVPQYLREAVEWRPESAGLRVAVNHKIAQVDEYAFCTCAVFSSLIE